jgi:hypothetical protein
MIFSSSTLLMVMKLAMASSVIPSVTAAAVELTTDQLYAKISPNAAPPAPGLNAEGSSVFTNLVRFFNEGQLFYVYPLTIVYEKPGSDPVLWTEFHWCGDLTFSDFINGSSPMGFAGRCVSMLMTGHAEAVASGAQIPNDYSEREFISTGAISAVFVDHLNVFEGQWHKDTDDYVAFHWDSGLKTSPFITWESHDEGDMSPNAATSSLSGFGELTWMTIEEVAQLLDRPTDYFTQENFKKLHKDTWIKDHLEEAEQNPNAEAELEIIEQVNGTQPSNETETPIQSNTVDEGGADGGSPAEAEDDPSGTGRKLASVAARFVSAALRVFGI